MNWKTEISQGFYYHYKHDSSGPINNYAYEVIWLVRHSEDKTHLVMYRPLYQNTYLSPALYSVRPLEMFMESIVVDGKSIPRFRLITDKQLIANLREIKNQMYQ